MEEGEWDISMNTNRPLCALFKTHFGSAKITFDNPFLRRRPALPRMR